MKNILVIGYSQTGQLFQILDRFLDTFEATKIERISLKPKDEFAFPWESSVFFDTMPECVLEEPVELLPLNFERKAYDLIIVAYQPWFLSPSLPTTSLFQNPEFLSLIKDTPIVTLIGARNMWINSQLSVVNWIENAGGKLVANIPFIDRNQNLLSVLAILHWMLKGKKERKWGLLPYPGVSKKDIKEAGELGQPVYNALQKDNYSELQKEILLQGKIDIHPSIMLIEARAKKLFEVWANLIKKKGVTPAKRNFWVKLYKYYLIIALFFISPIVLTIYTIFIRPFIGKRILKRKEELLYLGINKE